MYVYIPNAMLCCIFTATDGKVFSWGQNTFGQLGHGTTEYSKPHPQQIAVLDGLPIVSVHAGGYHSFVLTRSSSMYGWGRNK